MTNVDNQELRRTFLAGLPENELVETVLEHIPGTVYFFVKDAESRFMLANRKFWEKLGLKSGDEIIGKTDYDFFWALQADAYRRDDALVLRNGIPQIEKLEIIPTADGLVDWYRTSKIPLRGREGRPVGLVGIIHELRNSNSELQPYRTMEPVLRHIMNHYTEPLRAEQLAAVVGMSLPRFTRRFKREFKVTPGRYLAMVRLNAACRMLAGTSMSIAEVAVASGFYDHSFFTKQFVKYKGVTPREFRNRFREMPERARFFPLAFPEGRFLPDAES